MRSRCATFLRSLRPAALALLAAVAYAAAQGQPAGAHRLGVVFWHDSPNDIATFAGIRQGLAEGRLAHTFIEQHLDSQRERADAAFAALRAARCELVFAMGTQAALLAREALPDVPVVFAAVSDPVASGVVKSWAGSGTNLCGGSNWIAPKNVLLVFHLAVPGLQRLGMLRSADAGVTSAAEASSMRGHLAGPGKGQVHLHEAIAADAAGIPDAVAQLLQANVDAIWIPIDITIYQNLPRVQQALGPRRLPLLTTAAAGVRQGALVGAVVDYPLHGRRTALLALDVLQRGKAPGTLPVDLMRGNLVTVNLAAARSTGIALPLSLLVLADELLDPEVPNAGR